MVVLIPITKRKKGAHTHIYIHTSLKIVTYHPTVPLAVNIIARKLNMYSCPSAMQGVGQIPAKLKIH